MAAYEAHWVDPATQTRKWRTFSRRKDAVAFRDMPRFVPVEVELKRASELGERR